MLQFNHYTQHAHPAVACHVHACSHTWTASRSRIRPSHVAPLRLSAATPTKLLHNSSNLTRCRAHEEPSEVVHAESRLLDEDPQTAASSNSSEAGHTQFSSSGNSNRGRGSSRGSSYGRAVRVEGGVIDVEVTSSSTPSGSSAAHSDKPAGQPPSSSAAPASESTGEAAAAQRAEGPSSSETAEQQQQQQQHSEFERALASDEPVSFTHLLRMAWRDAQTAANDARQQQQQQQQQRGRSKNQRGAAGATPAAASQPPHKQSQQTPAAPPSSQLPATAALSGAQGAGDLQDGQQQQQQQQQQQKRKMWRGRRTWKSVSPLISPEQQQQQPQQPQQQAVGAAASGSAPSTAAPGTSPQSAAAAAGQGDVDDEDAIYREPRLTRLLNALVWLAFAWQWLPVAGLLGRAVVRGQWKELLAFCLVMPDTRALSMLQANYLSFWTAQWGAIFTSALLFSGLLPTWLYTAGLREVGEMLEQLVAPADLLAHVLVCAACAGLGQVLMPMHIFFITGPAVVCGLYISLAVHAAKDRAGLMVTPLGIVCLLAALPLCMFQPMLGIGGLVGGCVGGILAPFVTGLFVGLVYNVFVLLVMLVPALAHVPKALAKLAFAVAKAISQAVLGIIKTVHDL